jgi:DNA recombination protein RmuC
MPLWGIVALVALAAVVAAWMATRAVQRQSADQATALRQEINAQVALQSQTLTAQLGQVAQSLTAQLGQVNQQLQSGMASTGALVSGAQKDVSEQLRASTEMLGTIRQQLGEVKQVSSEVSDAAKHIETVLGGAKSRGTLGEVTLDRMLADTLPEAFFGTQHRFSTGEVVDAVVRLNGKLLPVDSKFPLDAYRRLVDTGEDCRKGFAQSVRLHVDSIAKKYILPDEDTLDIALMFVPSEGVYYELLRSETTAGTPLDEYCRLKRVIPVSPNTLFAHLRVIFMGLRGMQIEENAKRILADLTGLKKHIENFSDVFERLGTHLRNAQQSYADADHRLVRARSTVDDMVRGVPESKELEASSEVRSAR